jgi:hypothetical protein
MALFHTFRTWLDHKLKNDIYELCGSEIVHGRGLDSGSRLEVAEVRKWQVFPEMGFDVVEITLADGRQIRWIDKYDDLTGILRRAAPEREQAQRTIEQRC